MFALSDERVVAALLVTHARSCRRLRLEIAALLGNPAVAPELEAAALGRPGVVRASANPRSGRLLIEYEPDAPVLAELERLAQQPVRRAAAIVDGRAWHAESVDAVLARLATSGRDGLATEEAARRLGVAGINTIEDETPPSRLALATRQLANLPSALLLGSTIVSILLGDFVEAAAIVAVIGLDAAIGYRVERRSADLLASWRVAELGTCEVIRDGTIRPIAMAELVPGDVVVVRAGMVIGADARVIDAHRLGADESALPARASRWRRRTRRCAPMPSSRSAGRWCIAARRSRPGTGARWSSRRARRPRSRRCSGSPPRRGRRRSVCSAGSVRCHHGSRGRGWRRPGSPALASLAWRRNPLAIVRESVALGVAAIPEGLPVSATAALVRAMAHMRERGIVVRRLATAETLGGVTVACTDKTGTLTENRMRVDVVSIPTASPEAHRTGRARGVRGRVRAARRVDRGRRAEQRHRLPCTTGRSRAAPPSARSSSLRSVRASIRSRFAARGRGSG